MKHVKMRARVKHLPQTASQGFTSSSKASQATLTYQQQHAVESSDLHIYSVYRACYMGISLLQNASISPFLRLLLKDCHQKAINGTLPENTYCSIDQGVQKLRTTCHEMQDEEGLIRA